nr:MAG TPA: hypothetical protein [Caudoviricetes sp.]
MGNRETQSTVRGVTQGIVVDNDCSFWKNDVNPCAGRLEDRDGQLLEDRHSKHAAVRRKPLIVQCRSQVKLGEAVDVERDRRHQLSATGEFLELLLCASLESLLTEVFGVKAHWSASPPSMMSMMSRHCWSLRSCSFARRRATRAMSVCIM